MLKVMIVDNDLKRSKSLKQSLIDNGFEIIAQVKNDVDLYNKCREHQPDVVIMDIDSPSRDTLENICVISMHDARPIVIFSHDGDKDKIKAATQAGVSAYVVGVISSEKLTPVIDAAIARFEVFKKLRAELAVANMKLDERKIVERAKGLLMRQCNLHEEEAYRLLRSTAMQKKVKLADLAGQLVEAAKMLAV